jgi:hypothetical protein
MIVTNKENRIMMNESNTTKMVEGLSTRKRQGAQFLVEVINFALSRSKRQYFASNVQNTPHKQTLVKEGVL